MGRDSVQHRIDLIFFIIIFLRSKVMKSQRDKLRKTRSEMEIDLTIESPSLNAQDSSKKNRVSPPMFSLGGGSRQKSDDLLDMDDDIQVVDEDFTLDIGMSLT